MKDDAIVSHCFRDGRGHAFTIYRCYLLVHLGEQ